MSTNDRDRANYQINFPAEQASTMQDTGRTSQERRGKGGVDSIRIPNPEEETQLEQAGKQSQSDRQHPTGRIADSYTESSGGK